MRFASLNPRRLKTLLTRSVTGEKASPPREKISEELAPHLALGMRGERLAAEYLERLGYALVASNFQLPVGRNLRGVLVQAEIDIVAYEGRTLCFIEVKTRASDWFAAPEANVDLRKQRQIARAARRYRRMFGLQGEPFRYDVVSVVLPPEDVRGVRQAPRVEVLRNFWTDEKFRKRRWTEPSL
jgi:putative endonuclease